MAKKKKKSFQKGQLLSLFHNKNYQKVISKIKQFPIDGMSDEELRKIQLTSYEKLAESNFELGDINRAIRDIESLLALENSESYRLIKLKYLCYMEHFERAIEFASELIVSKNLKIKKEATFFYLLANIYSGNYEIDEKKLKLLPVARQNYILGFAEFCKGNKEEALSYFDKCNPRAKIEKENVQALKSIILDQEIEVSEDIKPLYRFLISGDDTNLQNTKNSRTVKKELLSQFAKSKGKRGIENLISLKSSTTVKIITDEVKDKEQQARLIYNNIVLLIEKQRNLSEALDIFIKNRNTLVQFVESGFLLIQIKSLIDNEKVNRLMVNFFTNYLKLHHKKLSESQLDFIFIFLLQVSQVNKTTINLIEEYGGEDILFLFKEMSTMDRVDSWHKEKFNKIMKKYSFFKDKALNGLADYIDIIDENIDIASQKDKLFFLEQLSNYLLLFKNCQKIHKNYQSTILKILSSMSKFVQNFEFSKHSELYIQLSNVINSFIETNKIDKSNLSEDIKTLFSSIKKKKSIKKEKKSDDENMFDMIKRILEEDDEYAEWMDEDEEYLDYEDLKRIKEDFIEALEDNENPFSDDLEDIENSFNNDIVFEFMLDLTAKAIEYNRYNDYFIRDFFQYMYFKPEESYYRDDLVVAIKDYAKRDVGTALLFFYDCIVLVPMSQRETVWYLKWLEAYVYLVDDYNQDKNGAFKGCLHHFIKVQEKKRFKTLNARFEKIIDRFKDKGLF